MMKATPKATRALVLGMVLSGVYLGLPEKADAGSYKCCGQAGCNIVNRDRPCDDNTDCLNTSYTSCCAGSGSGACNV